MNVLVTSTASDAHTWNLVYLQLLIEELGHRVVNLGGCVPDDLLVAACVHHRPDLIVIGTVNGHGRIDGMHTITRLRGDPRLADIPVVIGGKLGINGECSPAQREKLVAAGFDAVFEESDGLGSFTSLVRSLSAGAA